VFSVKLVARPDARMVEVPLEIEAELPREFEGNALLASSGLPRRVKIKAQKDALKLSTAYRADQLLADIVKITLRGTSQDVQRVQDAARAFVRTVRERRQDGASLAVTSNGRGRIEVIDSVPSPAPRAPAALEASQPRSGVQATLADRVAALEKRLEQLEGAFAGVAAGSDGARIAQLEERFTALQAQAGLPWPGSGDRPGAAAISRTPGATRRTTAVEAFAEGLRTELRDRLAAKLAAARLANELGDRAAALAAEAEHVLGAPKDGTSQRVRAAAAGAAAQRSALERMLEEVELYATPDLPVAAQLVARLEEAKAAPIEPGAELRGHAEALRRMPGGDAQARAAWLRRAAALCGWPPEGPAGNLVDAGAAPARAAAELAPSPPSIPEPEVEEAIQQALASGAAPESPPAAASASEKAPPPPEQLRADEPTKASPDAAAPPSREPGAAAIAEPHPAPLPPFGDLAGSGEISPDEAAAAAGSHPPRPSDQPAAAHEPAGAAPADNDEWEKLARGPRAFESDEDEDREYEVTDSDVEEVHDLADSPPEPKP
jgi:hypothetical protein